MSLDSIVRYASTVPVDARCLIMPPGEWSNELGLTRLFASHSLFVYSVALKVLRDPSAAEDVLQDVFMQLWHAPSNFNQERGNLQTWLATVTRNRSIDQLRKRRKTESFEDILLASSCDLVAEAERNITLQRVDILVADLSLEKRRVLQLAFVEGFTHSEIARVTKTPIGTVKTWIKSALDMLRRTLVTDANRSYEVTESQSSGDVEGCNLVAQ